MRRRAFRADSKIKTGTLSKSPPRVNFFVFYIGDTSRRFLYLWLCGAAITAPFPVLPHWAFFKRPIFLYLCVLGASIAAPFPFLPHWAFFKRPIATYFPLLAVQAAACQRRFNSKAIAIAPKIAAYSAGAGTDGAEYATLKPLTLPVNEAGSKYTTDASDFIRTPFCRNRRRMYRLCRPPCLYPLQARLHCPSGPKCRTNSDTFRAL